MHIRRPWRYAILAAIYMLSALAVTAQIIFGTILGTVHDETGAVLPGVTITITNTDTGLTRNTVTDEAGNYTVTLLPVGPYSVTSELVGFRKETRSGFVLQVDQKARIDFTMKVGEVTEELQVTAEAPLLQSETVTVGSVIDNRKVVELPLNGREFMQLNVLTPGVHPNVEGSNLSNQNTSVHANGAREGDNNFVLDGIDNNDLANNQLIVSPSIDAIQEFKIQTNASSAEFGRAAGGYITVTTKAGTNDLHGTLFHFLRNSALDAKNFFDPPGKPIPQFQRNQFGGTLGGPILKNRSFFFINYEGNRVRKGLSATARVPTVAQKRGDFSALATPIIDPTTGQPFPRNIIPSSRIHPIGAAMAAFYPDPNQAGANNYVSSPKFRDNADQFTTRLDHQIGPNDSIFARFTYSDDDRLEPFSRSPTTIGGFGNIFFTDGRSLTINETHVFSPHLINELRLGMNHIRGAIFNEGAGKDITGQIGIRDTQVARVGKGSQFGYPLVIVTGFSNVGERTVNPQDRRDTTQQIVETISVSRAGHQMRAGYEFRHFRMPIELASNFRGQYSFTGRYTGNGLADLLLGLPSQTQRGVGDDFADLSTRFHNWFLQDDWKVRPNLTLNLGLRWEYQTPIIERTDRQANFVPETGTMVLVGQGVLAGRRAPYRPDRNNYGPRFGLAWTPMPSTAMRMGYGVYYGWVTFADEFFVARFTTPFLNTEIYNADLRIPTISMSNPFPAGGGGSASSPRGMDINYRHGYMQQWNFTVQRELTANLALEVGYVGSKGTKLPWRTNNLNQPALGPGTVASRRPYPQFADIQFLRPMGKSNYHSLQAKLEKRFSGGLAFLTSYTWSKSLDIHSGSGGTGEFGDPQDNRNLHLERGLSIFDHRHRLVLSYLYELPIGRNWPSAANLLLGGWQLSGIMTFSSGQPFTPNFTRDVSGTAYFKDRPNRIGNGNLPRGQRDPARWVDPSAFVSAAAGSFGNAGRNVLIGPGINNWDFSLLKNHRFRENHNVQFRAEMFNMLNHPQFMLPNRFADSPAFGTISQARSAREIQFGLKWLF